jgi:hypothetical protein
MSTTVDGPDDNVRAQREALAATVGALAEKADVPARVKGEMSREVKRVKEQPAAVAAAIGLFLVCVLVLRRRKLRSRSSTRNQRVPRCVRQRSAPAAEPMAAETMFLLLPVL